MHERRLVPQFRCLVQDDSSEAHFGNRLIGMGTADNHSVLRLESEPPARQRLYRPTDLDERTAGGGGINLHNGATGGRGHKGAELLMTFI
jgi:hypothetical protein